MGVRRFVEGDVVDGPPRRPSRPPASVTAVWPPWAPTAVVFDLDGLLVDSEPLWGLAEERVVLNLGHPWDPEIHTLLLGKGPEDAAATLAALLGGVHTDEVKRRMLVAAIAAFEGGVEAQPGAHELIRSLRGRLPLAVATNSRRMLAELALASAGFDGHFQAVVCAEDVRAPKPAPDPYQAACARLGVDPASSVAFEDSPTGVASAKAAGLWVVGCPSVPGQEALAGADAVVMRLVDVPAYR